MWRYGIIFYYDIRKNIQTMLLEICDPAMDILNRSQQPITELQNILEEAKNDAFPEVRFAETDEFYKLWIN